MSLHDRVWLIILLSWPADRPKADAGRSYPCESVKSVDRQDARVEGSPNSCVEHIPAVMLPLTISATAGEFFIKHGERFDLRDIEHSPAG